MAEILQPKCPVPRLPLLSCTVKQSKKIKTVVEKATTKKRLDQARSQTRVNIGVAFQRWRRLMEVKGLKSDAMVAVFLLDSYEKNASSAPSTQGLTGPPPSALSTILSDCPSGRDGVKELDDSSAQETDIKQLDARTGGALKTQISLDALPAISAEDSGHGAVDNSQDPTSTDIPPFPEMAKVLVEDDKIGHPASITYHDCLKQLAEHLILPVSMCTAKDPNTKMECRAPRPFEINVKSRGTAAIVEWMCPHGHTVWKWTSQPTLKYGMLVGDFLLASNILLSGNNYAKISLLFKFMKMGMVEKSSFFKIQDSYCVETINDFWNEKKDKIMNQLHTMDICHGSKSLGRKIHAESSCKYPSYENPSDHLHEANHGQQQGDQPSDVNIKTEDEKYGAAYEVVVEVPWIPSQPEKVKPQRHQKRKDRKHFCQLCKKEFSTQSHLRQHTKKHHGGIRPYKCTFCPKRFTFRNPLIVHLRTHTRKKPFFCPLMRRVRSRRKTHTKEPAVMTNVQVEEDAVGVLINSEGEELEWDPANSETPRKRQKKTEAEKLFSCTDCSKVFQSAYARDHHLREKHGKPLLHKCSKCGQTFRANRSLLVHQRIYHPAPAAAAEPQEEGSAPNTYVWSMCGKRFPTSVSLKRHLMIHSGKKPYKCTLCGRGFTQIGNLKTHEKVHKGKFTNTVALEKRPKKVSQRALPDSNGEDPTREPPDVGTCADSDGDDPTWEPPDVGACADSDGDDPTWEPPDVEPLRRSQPDGELSGSREQLQEKPPEEPKQYQGPCRPKKNYNCPTCGRVFSNNTALQRHLVIHSGKKPFKCFICGRGFTQRGNLKTHMKVHRGELPDWKLVKEKSPPKESPVTVYMCAECGMDFPQKQQLEEHRESHKKPYACPDCGKSFKSEGYFKLHKRIHSVDSPFLCSECGKVCVTADSLKKHELTHTGEKNFHCKQCGRAFSRSSNLNVHLKTHSGERPHLCSICGKSYSKASVLKVHLRVHTGEKPYTCEKCGKCFYYSQGYQKHLKIHDKKPKLQTKPLGRPKQQQLVVNNH